MHIFDFPVACKSSLIMQIDNSSLLLLGSSALFCMIDGCFRLANPWPRDGMHYRFYVMKFSLKKNALVKLVCFCERVGLCLQVSPKPQKWSLCEVTGLDILGIERPDKEHVPVRFV